MRAHKGRDWTSLTSLDSIQDDPTPPAKLAFLHAADRWALDAATQPYGSAASIFRGGETGLVTRHFRTVVAAGGERARYHVAVGFTSVQAASANVAATTAYGGIAGNDPTKLAIPWGFTRAVDPELLLYRQNYMSGDDPEDTPAANLDRMLELESLAHPKVEPGSISNCCGFSVVVARHVADLETL